MEYDLKDIFEQFDSGATFRKGNMFGNGHIHDTYLIVTSEDEGDDFILQRLNNNVFRNIPELQNNIQRVTTHMRDKLVKRTGSDIKRECLTLVPSKDGRSWIRDKEDNYWRMYIFIKDHRSYEIVDTPEKAFEGGKAIGRFQAILNDLSGEPLYETIPSFHDIDKRIDHFKIILAEDPAGRVKTTGSEIDFILENAEKMLIINRLAKEGRIPVRITHNDTKFNNILFDKNDKSLCIVDLDTVMNGYFHSDFGDTIRTGANRAAEDEEDLSKIKMDIDLFGAFAQGYLSETREILNSVEKEYLAFAPLVMTYEQALRFLDDYINGDKYYKIKHEHHNLQRARSQIKLLSSMEEQYQVMRERVRKVV